MKFAILYTQGPNWVEGTDIYHQPAEDHDQYVIEWMEAGKVLLAGPFSDDSGGIVVIEVKDAAEAQQFFDADPGLLSGVFRGTLHPWHVVFEKYR